MSITLKNEPAEVNFVFLRGDDYRYDFTICDDDGTPVDLTGWNVLSTARESPYATKLYDIPFKITNPKLGIISLDITNAFTADMGTAGRVMEMKYDVQLESPAKLVVTFMKGFIKVEGDYARVGV